MNRISVVNSSCELIIKTYLSSLISLFFIETVLDLSVISSFFIKFIGVSMSYRLSLMVLIVSKVWGIIAEVFCSAKVS